METVSGLVGIINGVVWGPPMLVLILGTGLYLMLGLRFFSITAYRPGLFTAV